MYTKDSIAWSPTIALSWLWGLGFFYAIQVTLEYGWLGFLSFAGPSALGLLLFGWILGSPNRDPAAILKAAESAYAGLFLLSQLCAVAITIFGFAAYLWLPIGFPHPVIGVGVLVLGACAVGHVASLRVLKSLHAGYLLVGVIAAAVALYGLRTATTGAALPTTAVDGRFYGLIAPMLVSFLLGPWSDIRQWQRAAEIRRRGGSVRLAYTFGAILYFALLTINALLASASGPMGALPVADGVPIAQPAVAYAVARSGIHAAIIAYFIWAALAVVSMIDSFYHAARSLMRSIVARSLSPLLAFIPAGFVSSPLWIVLVAIAISVATIKANLPQSYLTAPFATLLVGSAACLLSESLGAPRRYDSVLCYLIGLAASLILLAGYLVPIPELMAVAPLVALLGAAPMVAELFGWRMVSSAAAETTSPDDQESSAGVAVAIGPLETTASHGFDGQTFVMRLIPTYDDTNSVGNIYFANYMRWVGKARELFFDTCMPDFDLKTTEYYVLTRSFSHRFRREAREFEPITVRIKVAGLNRKFVTMEHEIHGDTLGLLGRGEQSLMFVDVKDFRPLDVPRALIEGFFPYLPKNSPTVADVSDRRSPDARQLPSIDR